MLASPFEWVLLYLHPFPLFRATLPRVTHAVPRPASFSARLSLREPQLRPQARRQGPRAVRERRRGERRRRVHAQPISRRARSSSADETIRERRLRAIVANSKSVTSRRARRASENASRMAAAAAAEIGTDGESRPRELHRRHRRPTADRDHRARHPRHVCRSARRSARRRRGNHDDGYVRESDVAQRRATRRSPGWRRARA